MNTAIKDKIASKRVLNYPPIIISADNITIGNPVWCGNDSVADYLQWKKCNKCGMDKMQCLVKGCIK